MPVLKHVTWASMVVLLTTCMNLTPSKGTTYGHTGGTTYINTGGWSSGGHK
ncbi:MAG: hypothetical protein VXW65_03180 [Pseudomonadota bacterium]|nr:hypothetical protein [Pseudomonadota bacterium]